MGKKYIFYIIIIYDYIYLYMCLYEKFFIEDIFCRKYSFRDNEKEQKYPNNFELTQHSFSILFPISYSFSSEQFRINKFANLDLIL